VQTPEPGLATLARFYRFHASIYDWTRPFILFGRRRILEGLVVTTGTRVLDVGCGTGTSLTWLVQHGGVVTGIECTAAMRARAQRRIEAQRLAVDLDDRPYGTHDGYRDSVDRVLFSYSLSMIPAFESALDSARGDLRFAGRIGVVDFLDATSPATRAWLRASHVFLGEDRLAMLRRLFPRHRLEIHRGYGWRYFLFWGNCA
jgi:S-adenosylmethionine-diacylgycerolhomoserine-N-methlytransferase